MKKIIFYAGIFSVLLFTTGCGSVKNIADLLPTAEFHKFKVKKFEPAIRMEPFKVSAKMTIGLCFRFHNPYNRELTLPAPELQFNIRNHELLAMNRVEDLATLKIPAKKHLDVYYDYEIQMDPESAFLNLLGKDNPYSFKCTMVINLRDYIKDSIATRFANQAIPIVSRFVERDVSRYKLEIVYDDTLRLPLPPVIQPDLTRPPSLGLKGQMETLDLRPVRNIMNPFVRAIRETTITVPIDHDVIVIQQMLDILSGFGLDLTQKWDDFVEGWTDFQNQPVLKYPGTNTTGIEIKVPIKVYNPNEFEIECPQFEIKTMSDIDNANSYTPFYVSQKAATSNPMIAAKGTKQVWITSGINWNSGYTLPNIILGTTPAIPHPGVKGAFTYDLGYGSMNIPFSFGVDNFQFWR